MSGRLHLSRIPVTPSIRLPHDARQALVLAKNRIKDGPPLARFQNRPDRASGDGPPLPALSHGCEYFEYPVGTARQGDPRRRGSRRLVLEVHVESRRIVESCFTEQHYEKFSFVRVV
jgi:hypothetical protein